MGKVNKLVMENDAIHREKVEKEIERKAKKAAHERAARALGLRNKDEKKRYEKDSIVTSIGKQWINALNGSKDISDTFNRKSLLQNVSGNQMVLVGIQGKPVRQTSSTTITSGTCKFCADSCSAGCDESSCICCLGYLACNHTDGGCICSNPELEKRPRLKIVEEQFLKKSGIVNPNMCYGIELLESVRLNGVITEYTGPIIDKEVERQLVATGEGNYLMKIPRPIDYSGITPLQFINGKYGSEARLINYVCEFTARNVRPLPWHYRDDEGNITHTRIFIHANKLLHITDNTSSIPLYMGYGGEDQQKEGDGGRKKQNRSSLEEACLCKMNSKCKAGKVKMFT
jgi:hypothetical protein